MVGVTGSIAAYKSAVLIRLLVKQGAEVKVVMTDAAQAFISKLTLSVLSKNEVFTDIFSEGQWHNHVELGLWADCMIIAPCTATTLSKMSSGLADNMLTATYLSAKCPVFIAPAMDLDMWKHGSTKRNIEALISYGNTIIDVAHGELASGLVGDGRMAEPESIVDFVSRRLNPDSLLSGKRIVITAGPTYEYIDPVRFIGNKSSGKMGMALAKACAKKGAVVELIIGPNSLAIPHESIKVVNVVTGQEMKDAVEQSLPNADVIILSAAVADYKPAAVAREKIKKKEESLQLNLVKTDDIAAFVGEHKSKTQMSVGFALETQNEEENARAKLLRKKMDLIVLNSLNDDGAGFGVDTNKVTIFSKDGQKKAFDLKSKDAVAEDIVREIEHRLAALA